MVLRTLVFAERHTGDNIAKELKEIRAQFSLDEKTVIYITDQGSNVVKACKIAGSERFGCVAHGLHNLIAVEGISKGPDIQTIMCKVKDIIKTFTFKNSLLETEAADMANEQLVADLECILEDVDKDQEIGYDSCLWEDEEQLDNDIHMQVYFVDVAVTPVRQQYDYIEEGLPNQMELFVVHDG
jgi:hypothetical protein